LFNAPVPPRSELPTPRELLRSTAIAVAVAALLLVTIVLPAEYGVDPTGIGEALGLRRMGEIKVALALEAEADAAADAAAAAAEEALRAGSAPAPEATAASGSAEASALKSDLIDIALQPDEGREFKLVMSEGASVTFEWWTDGGAVNYDTHGDPPNPPANFYHGYGRGTGETAQEGVLVAAFDGVHGWFWRNRTPEPVVVTLHVQGEYHELREIQ
jgi:hypothetical protein